MHNLDRKLWLLMPIIVALALLWISSPASAETAIPPSPGTPPSSPGTTPSPIITSSPSPTTFETLTFTPTISSTPALTSTASLSPTPTTSATPFPTSSPTTPGTTTTPTFTATPMPSASATPSATSTTTPTAPAAGAVSVLTNADTGLIYLPLTVYQNPPIVPVTKGLFCTSPSKSIPDNDANGASSTIQIADPRIIADLDIYLKVDHSWIGDLEVVLTHQDTGKTIELFDRPGYPKSSTGCGKDNIRAIFDDEMTWHVETKCASYPAAISGSYESDGLLSTFDDESIAGDWTLTVSDLSAGDQGTLSKWCLVGQISENPPPPTPSPPIPPVPREKIIGGVHGRSQALPLDCESRSAVDWANYFGYQIDELEFFRHLPHSDNPDQGFVGSVYGRWGQIPPYPYGVHAEPVAELLRAYGANAVARRPLSWGGLRAEIAAGRPVIVWIIGYHTNPKDQSPLLNGEPVYYTPNDGLHTVVAKWEHTVIVTGYNSSNIQYLNGGTLYWIDSDKFLDSWSALGNMAITWGEP